MDMPYNKAVGLIENQFNKGVDAAVAHSSGMVDPTSATSSTFGSLSTQSFGQRRAAEINRQHINGYNRADVLHTYRQQSRETSGHVSAVPIQKTISSTTSRVLERRQAADTHPTKSLMIPKRPAGSGFVEPVRRTYNPYG